MKKKEYSVGKFNVAHAPTYCIRMMNFDLFAMKKLTGAKGPRSLTLVDSRYSCVQSWGRGCILVLVLL